MEAAGRVARLHRQMAAMVALEQTIEDQLDEISAGEDGKASGGERLQTLLTDLRELTGGQRRALTVRLEAIARDVSVPELAPPVSSLHRLEDKEHPASAALFALHASYAQAAVGYAVLMELAFRAADSVELVGPDNTGDLARQHLRAYVAVLREIIRAVPRVVVDELEGEGQECQCICPSCGLGVCLCWLAFRRQLAMAWADAGPIDALAGIELVRPRSGSAADRAGLREGDVLLAVESAAIDSIPILQDAIRSHGSGDEITFEVQRESDERAEVRVVRQ